MAYAGYGHGFEQEEIRNFEEATLAEELQVCDSFISELGYPKEIRLGDMSPKMKKACQFKQEPDVTVESSGQSIRVSGIEFMAALPTEDEISEKVDRLEEDASDFNQSIPLGYAGLFALIGSGYGLMAFMIKSEGYY